MTQPTAHARESTFSLDSQRRTAPARAADGRAHGQHRLSIGLHFLIAVSCLAALVVIIRTETLEEMASYPTGVLGATAALFCVGTISSMVLIRRIPHAGLDAFDPGLLMVLFVFGSIAPVIVTGAFGDPLLRFQDVRLEPLLPKVVMLHLILIVAFAATYHLVNRKIRPAASTGSNRLNSVPVWVLLAIVIATVSFSIEAASNVLFTRAMGDSMDISREYLQSTGLTAQQGIQLLRRMRAYAIVFALGVLACRAATPRGALRILVLTVPALGLAYFTIFASRGFLISTMLGAAAFVDAAKFKGNLLTKKTLAIGFVGGIAMLQVMDAAESFAVYGRRPSASDLRLATVLDYGIVENSALIVNWIDSGTEAHWNGSSYSTAVFSVLPAQIRGPITDLPRWFVRLAEPEEAEMGKGRGFSAVAEGYLNWGAAGVAIQGAILALLASVIRFFRVSRRLGALGPYLFAASLPLSYTLFRMDVSGVLSRLKNYAIEVPILVGVAILMIAIARRSPSHRRAGASFRRLA